MRVTARGRSWVAYLAVLGCASGCLVGQTAPPDPVGGGEPSVPVPDLGSVEVDLAVNDLTQPPPEVDAAAADLTPACSPLDFDPSAWAVALPATLGQTGLDHPDAHQFTPEVPFFSDGASKTRKVRLPCGTTIDTSSADDWQFPTGTRFWKEFSVLDSAGDYVRVETRMSVKVSATEWRFGVYVWRTDNSEADLAIGPVAAVRGTTHTSGNPATCLGCHGQDKVLGMSAVQARPETIAWLNEGRSTPFVVSYTPPGDPIEGFALRYLHSNCAPCHDNRGAPTTRYRLSPSNVTPESTQTYATTRNVPTGRTDYPFYILPGDATQSFVLARIALGQMPQGATVVDTQAQIQLVDWVTRMQ